MKFIILTLMSGEKIRVNMANIESYGVINEKTYEICIDLYEEKYEGMTYLLPLCCGEEVPVYIVKETPEEIDSLLHCTMYGF